MKVGFSLRFAKIGKKRVNQNRPMIFSDGLGGALAGLLLRSCEKKKPGTVSVFLTLSPRVDNCVLSVVFLLLQLENLFWKRP